MIDFIMKICSKCKKTLELTEFGLVNGKPYSQCKSCKHKSDRLSYLNHRQARIQKACEYQKHHYVPKKDWSAINCRVVELLLSGKKSQQEIAQELSIGIMTVHRIKQKKHIVQNKIYLKSIEICKFCGREFHPGPSSIYCSKACYTAWQKTEENHGQNNPNWKHGRDSGIDRKSESWKLWRKQIFERDQYKCQFCGEKGKKLHPHHILPRRDCPEKTYDVANGITLCEQCHGKTVNREYNYIDQCIVALSNSESLRAYQPYFR